VVVQENPYMYKNIIDNLDDAVYYVDDKRKILYWNEKAEEVTGYKASEVVSKYCWSNILQHIDSQGTHICTKRCPLHHTILDGKMRESHFYLRHKAGHRVPVYLKTLPIKGKYNEVKGAIEIFNNHSGQDSVKKKLKELKKINMLDPLSGLPNKEYLLESIKKQYSNYKENKQKFSIAYFNIDNFKKFNDKYGREKGDEIIKTLSKTFINNIKGDDIVGRGDGFDFLGVFLISDKLKLDAILNKLRLLLKNTTVKTSNGKEDIFVTISVGGVVVNELHSLEDLLKTALDYLKIGKKLGKDQVRVSEISVLFDLEE